MNREIIFKHKELMIEKYKKRCKNINSVKNLLICVLTVTGCLSISAFVSLVCVPVGIVTSAVEMKIRAITAGSKRHKSIIKKKEKRHDKIVL